MRHEPTTLPPQLALSPHDGTSPLGSTPQEVDNTMAITKSLFMFTPKVEVCGPYHNQTINE